MFQEITNSINKAISSLKEQAQNYLKSLTPEEEEQ